jgi:hypothetical protein
MATEGVDVFLPGRRIDPVPGLGRRPFCENFLERFENLNRLRDPCGRMGAAVLRANVPGPAVGSRQAGQDRVQFIHSATGRRMARLMLPRGVIRLVDAGSGSVHRFRIAPANVRSV